MKRLRPSTVRRFLLWYFDRPSNDPYVSLTFEVAVAPALEFLDAFAREHGSRVGLQHLVTKAVGQCLRDLPAVHVKIFGRSIYALDHVHVAAPVHLGADPRASGGDETGLIIVRDVDRKGLAEIARETRRGASAERGDKASMQGSALLRRAARGAPAPLFYGGLALVGRLLERPEVHQLADEALGASSVVTNIGAVFRLPQGARFRSASLSVPDKAGPMTTVFGLGPVEAAPVVRDGRVQAGQVLPVLAVVDHRAVDGVLMATLASKLAGYLLDPRSLPGVSAPRRSPDLLAVK